jgi:hypothetical protein
MNIAGNTQILIKTPSGRSYITRICSHTFNLALRNRGADFVVFDPASGSQIHLSSKNPTWYDAARLIRQGKKVVASVGEKPVRKVAAKEAAGSTSKPTKRVRKPAKSKEMPLSTEAV